MKKIQKYAITLSFLVLVSVAVQALSKTVDDMKVDINWPAFMSRNDLVWTQMPDGWTSGAFTGNGIVGTIFWQQPGGLYFEISRTDAYDHRNSNSIYTGRYRLPNGNFMLEYAGKNPEGQMRLDLWNAEARAIVKTDKGSIRLRNLTHASEEVILLEVTVEGNEQFKLSWHPDTCQTSRPAERGKSGTVPYPMATQQIRDGVSVSIQSMPESTLYDTQGRGEGQLATAWKIREAGKGKYLVYISEVYSYPGTMAAETAVKNVRHAASQEIKNFEKSHREWWHNYYSKSFLSLPNSRLESFYWIQLYKMASATRENRPMIDLAGPWYKRGTPWPGIWWNLNVQCTYAPFPFANHVEEGNSLVNWLWKYRDNLERNAQGNGRYAIGRSCPITLERECPTEKYEAGNLGYALFNVWEHYRCTMNDQLLKEKLYPLIKGHFRFLADFYLEKRADGKYHLKASGSPEYTREGYPAPTDCNYNLSIFRWMMNAMLYADNRLKLNDPLIPEVKNILANLTDFPTDAAEGLMVGENQKFAYSHRHWSHLFMIYPFYEYTYDNQQQGLMIDKSLAHWLSYSEAYRGYSWLAAASMTAMKGDGDKAVEFILASLDHNRFPAQPNTMYIEAGPVIETPLLGARTIQDISLTSYNQVIRIFPGLPASWKDAAFHSMRAEGAFLVSAKREQGKTSFVRIESLAGEPCRVKTGISGEIKAYGVRPFKLTDRGNGVTEIDLKKGEWVIFYSGLLPDLNIAPAPVADPVNYWGTVTHQVKNVKEL
jgi:hypothetical protein